MKDIMKGKEIVYRFPKLGIDRLNARWGLSGGVGLIGNRLRLWNKNANKWVWFNNPKPCIDSYSIECTRGRGERYFSDFIVKGNQ